MSVSKKYSRLFERVKLGNVKLRNRFGTPPMGTFAEDHWGLMTQSQVKYYEARAKGGMGLVMLEGQNVTDKFFEATAGKTLLDTEAQMKQWALIAESIHAHGAKAGIQFTPGIGRCMGATEDGPAPVSASAVPAACNPNIICREITTEEVKETIAAFGRYAERAARAEFDVIELNVHAGFMLDQFITPIWNKRTDEYGGSFENRMRIIDEIYELTRKMVGPDVAIGFRVGMWHGFEGGRTLEEGIEICKHVEKLGFDFLDIDVGCEEASEWNNPAIYMGNGTYAAAAAEAKKVVSIPVIASGMHNANTALEAVESGALDVVLLGRPSIADPDFPKKLQAGHPEDIRVCLACNEYCVGRLYAGRQITCAVNAQAGREDDFAITAVSDPKNVVIVGGGPAGMEAARVAALRGHNVTLFEKGAELGGSLSASAKLPYKGRYLGYLNYLKNQLKKLGVSVVHNKEVSVDDPELGAADHIIVAVGATPVLPNIWMGSGSTVVSAEEAVENAGSYQGKTVVVVGGGTTGADTALGLAMCGAQVAIVERSDAIASSILVVPNRIALMKKLDEFDVQQITNVEVTGIDGGLVVGQGLSEPISMKADVVVIACGVAANSDLADAIYDKYSNVRVVGDCNKVGGVGDAVRAGYFAGWSID